MKPITTMKQLRRRLSKAHLRLEQIRRSAIFPLASPSPLEFINDDHPVVVDLDSIIQKLLSLTGELSRIQLQIKRMAKEEKKRQLALRKPTSFAKGRPLPLETPVPKKRRAPNA